MNEDILICGHTHIPYHRAVFDKLFINSGSVGKPIHGGPQDSYIVVDVKDGEVKSEIIYVDYDVESMVKAIEDNKMIFNKLIAMLQEGF